WQAALAYGDHMQEIETAHAGEIDVQDDGVRALAFERAEGSFGSAHDDGVVPHLGEEVAEHFAESLFILDDEYSHDCPASLACRPGTPRRRRTRARSSQRLVAAG